MTTAVTIVLSCLPVVTLLAALAVFRLKAWKAAVLSLAIAATCALAAFRGTLAPAALPGSILSGVELALYPICLVILAALFTYGVTVKSGAMDVIRKGLAGVSSDRRIVALLIVWGFGNFMEGMAGFGTAVAIPASILVGIGFNPLKAVLVCLVANTTPTAFGSVGVPILTLAKVSGMDPVVLTHYAAGLQLAVTALGPFLVLLTLEGRKGLKGLVGLACAVDAVFLVPWALSARFIGLELPDILGGLAVMALLVIRSVRSGLKLDGREQARAWLPFGLVVLILMIAAFIPTGWKKFASPGILILIAATAGGLCQKLSLKSLGGLLLKTAWSYRAAFGTICAVLAMARVMGDAGMIATLAQALVTATGSFYPIVSPVVGALGGFVTGSGTSSCVLFGAMQADVARQIGITPEILGAANVMGAGIGKMICPQSIAIGAAATALVGQESAIMKKALVWFVLVMSVACITTSLVATLSK